MQYKDKWMHDSGEGSSQKRKKKEPKKKGKKKKLYVYFLSQSAFLFHYVHYFRVLYHKLSAQATQKGATIDQAVVRPVAEHGAVEMPCQLHERESNGSASPTLVPAPTLHQLLIPFSRGGPWLKKESMTDPNSHHTRCHSPVSTHHVDHPTTEELLER